MCAYYCKDTGERLQLILKKPCDILGNVKANASSRLATVLAVA